MTSPRNSRSAIITATPEFKLVSRPGALNESHSRSVGQPFTVEKDEGKEKEGEKEKGSAGSGTQTRAGSIGDIPWKPLRDQGRRHSWNQEDMKHELHSRFLNVEKEKEAGFTED